MTRKKQYYILYWKIINELEIHKKVVRFLVLID